MLSRYDLVLYDLPHVGSSKPHNDPDRPITVQDEVTILADVAAHYRPRYLVAMSWGGAAALSLWRRGGFRSRRWFSVRSATGLPTRCAVS